MTEAVAALDAHAAWLGESRDGGRRRVLRARARLLSLLEDRFHRAVEARAPEPEGLEEAVASVIAGREDPYSAAGRLFERLMRAGDVAVSGRARA